MNETAEQPRFDAVARELAQPLLRYLERYVGDRGLAEDLRQETLLRIERGLPGFAGRAALKTWAFSIANHVATDYLRQLAQRLKLVDMDEAVQVPTDALPLDEAVVVDEMNTCLRDVIASLPPDYRSALILHDLESMSLEQTAAVAGCTLATVKIRIHRARQRLKAALAQQCSFYRDDNDVFRCTKN